MPVGLPPPPVIVQLPTSEPGSVYLNTLSCTASLTTHKCVPSVTMSLGLVLLLFRLKLLAAFWLPERRLAASVYLKTLSLWHRRSNVGAVGGDAFDGGVAGQRAGGPGAEQAAAGVVDIDLAIGIDDPDLVARRRADGSAWGGVVVAQG